MIKTYSCLYQPTTKPSVVETNAMKAMKESTGKRPAMNLGNITDRFHE